MTAKEKLLNSITWAIPRTVAVPINASLNMQVRGTSMHSQYIPLFGLKHGDMVIRDKKRVLIYAYPESRYILSRVRNSTGLFGVYTDLLFPPSTRAEGFRLAGYEYHAAFGSLAVKSATAGVSKILFLLTLRRDKFWNYANNPNVEDLAIIVSRDFMNTSSAVKTKIKPYFTALESMDIPFIIVDSIEKFCYTIPMSLPTFSSLQEKMEYMSNLHNFIPKAQTDVETKKQKLAEEARSIAPPTEFFETEDSATLFA